MTSQTATGGRLKAFVEHASFERFITVLIILNAITLGIETSPVAVHALGMILVGFDIAILSVFVIEIGLKLIVYRVQFWRDPWRVFDFIIVGIALVPSAGAFAALRAFRVLRVLRLVSTVPAMRRVVSGLLEALPGMGSVVLLLLVIFYVFSVIATKLFGADFPALFGTLGNSAFTLFQIMTLESWAEGIVRPVMDRYPFAWAFFLPFIVATSFAVLNLFIGIIVDAMQRENEETAAEQREAMMEETDEVLDEVRALRRDVAELRRELHRR